MGLFGNNVKKIIQEFRKKSEYYSNDLGKEIKESFEDLKSDYDENVIPEFMDFVSELKQKLDISDSKKLENFSIRLSKINRNAKNGVEAMRELSVNQRKLSVETLREYEEFGY